MATDLSPINLQELPLNKPFKIGDSTFDVVGRFENTNAGTYTVGKQILCFSIGEDVSKRENAYVNVVANPTLIDATDGVYRYTVTTRGLDSDNKAIPPTLYSTDRQKLHPAGRKVGIVISSEYFSELDSNFVENSALIDKVAKGAVNEGYAVYLDTDGTVIEGVNSGEWYGIATATVATTETVAIAMPGREVTGITVPGSIGDRVYATAAGALTATSTGNTFVGIKSGANSMTVQKESTTTSFSDDEFEIVGSADATKKVAFEVDTNVTTATTRTMTIPDANITIGARNSVVSCIPKPASVNFASGVTQIVLNADNTTAHWGMVNIPYEISASKLSIYVGGWTAASTLDIALYTLPDNSVTATKYLEITTASIGAAGNITTSFTSTKINPGNYYVAFIANIVTVNMNISTWDSDDNGGSGLGKTLSYIGGASYIDYVGTSTETAGTLPATKNVSGLSTTYNSCLMFRLDNV